MGGNNGHFVDVPQHPYSRVSFGHRDTSIASWPEESLRESYDSDPGDNGHLVQPFWSFLRYVYATHSEQTPSGSSLNAW